MHAWTVFGGMPRYLAQLRDDLSVGENYERLVLDPDGPLHEETHRLLGAELNEPRVYASILLAISRGKTRAGEIINVAGIKPGSNLQKYVERLEKLGLVRRQRSANAAPAARNLRYSLADPFIASWYRYALPHISALKVRGGDGAWQRLVAPTLDKDQGAAPATFEDISRSWTALHMNEFWEGEHGEVGQLLQGSGGEAAEIDVACRLGRGQRPAGCWASASGAPAPRASGPCASRRTMPPGSWGRPRSASGCSSAGMASRKSSGPPPRSQTRLVDLTDLYSGRWTRAHRGGRS